jgi:hypothetical protein
MEKLIFSVFSTEFFLEELKVADTVLVPLVFVERVVVVGSPLRPIFLKISCNIFEEAFIEIVFIGAVGVRAFSHGDTAEIL